MEICSRYKNETIKSLKTLDLLKKSGLTFFSFSPESGSKI